MYERRFTGVVTSDPKTRATDASTQVLTMFRGPGGSSDIQTSSTAESNHVSKLVTRMITFGYRDRSMCQQKVQDRRGEDMTTRA